MDPIAAISGLLDAGSFDDDDTAYGTKITAELTQLLNKTNEIVTGITALAAEVVTNDTDIATNATGVETNLSNLIAALSLISTNTQDIAELQTQTLANTIVITGNTSLTHAQIADARVVYLDSTTSKIVTLPDGEFSSGSYETNRNPVLFINNYNITGAVVFMVKVHADGYWANGDAGGDTDVIKLAEGEGVWIYPVEDNTPDAGGNNSIYWAICGGKAYSDLTPV